MGEGEMREILPDPDQIELQIKQRDLGMLEMVKEQIDGKSGYSAGTKFGIMLALKILGLEGKA